MVVSVAGLSALARGGSAAAGAEAAPRGTAVGAARGRSVSWAEPEAAEGEDAAAYDELLLRISSAVRPGDIFEEIWVRDIVNLTWEALRLRRLKACLMTAGARRALELDLRPLVGFDQAQGLARGWAARWGCRASSSRTSRSCRRAVSRAAA